MAEATNRSGLVPEAQAATMALVEQAEAEAAEAEALAVAARTRARAIALRRKAQAKVVHKEETAAEAPAQIGVSAGAGETNNAAALSRRLRLRAGRASRAVSVAAVVVIGGLLSASGYMMWHHHGAVEQRQRSAAFVAAAKQCVVNMTSFDFTRAEKDVQRVIDSSTGGFRDDFRKQAKDFSSAVKRSKVITEGTVKSAAVESMNRDSAVVLVSATSRVTNSAGVKEQPRGWRLRVTVTQDRGQIKMSKLVFVP
jgi:Mce-associated membrane protein